MSWTPYVRTLALSVVIVLAVAFGLIMLMNPYGNLPFRLAGQHVMMDSNRRFQLAAALRYGNFDSVILGTSTSMLLDPEDFDRVLGGRFLNAAMENSRAWEQYQAGLLFLRNPRPRATLLIGLDHVWCFPDADENRITERGFPDWLYDDDPSNDWPWMFNSKSLEVAGLLVLHRLSLLGPRIAINGREVFTPPEHRYDAKKAANKIWQSRKRDAPRQEGGFSASDRERQSWRYPALEWLEELLAMTRAGTRSVLAYMPIHIAAQPLPGTRADAREQECKRRIMALADQYGAHVVDFRIASPVTSEDLNYWDPLHYRVPVATLIAEGIATALSTQSDDPGGFWRYRTGPARAAQNQY